ncbi:MULTISPECIES: hypothetical protein [Salibacter]|jgi:two-component SAPR family response regulator|uniref:Uncharacterized protein n=1 Tax=Salibacter halophilus TaxID=1803916 RepID=A0A6N6M5D7_9FLAO|nr:MULTISPECIES: hypothetical protein [Salibacter]KAB1062005.1 hypothetical protein F3059_13085 [Salibacter halophilus]MDR9398098.1 hypothetical protein [Salibacter sp.]MDR9487276.1 hypothetical protein [Salibacter sp.]
MATSTSQKKEKVLKKLVKKLEKEGYDELKTRFAGYKTPIDLNYNGSMKKFTPDLVAVKDEVSDVYEIEHKMKEREIQDQVAKWILFSSYSKQNRGKFKLLVPKDRAEKFQNLIDRMMIDAELVKLENIA